MNEACVRTWTLSCRHQRARRVSKYKNKIYTVKEGNQGVKMSGPHVLKDN